MTLPAHSAREQFAPGALFQFAINVLGEPVLPGTAASQSAPPTPRVDA